MANNLFGGLGNLGGALGGFVSELAKSGLAPKDDPAAKLVGVQAELASLHGQEAQVLAEIGRVAFAANPDAYPQGEKLRLIMGDIAAAQEQMAAINREIEMAGQEQAAGAAVECPNCGHSNQEGIKFCQECGTKLEASYCSSCGAALKPGARFCGECGARQDS